MIFKYEIAYEVYSYIRGNWKLLNIPKQVAMYDSYEEAVKEYGPFKKKLTVTNGFSKINVYTLYELQIDEQKDVIDATEIGYKIISN